MNASNVESLDLATATIVFSIDQDLYPREALYAAAYIFLDRAYVLLDRAGDRFTIRLRSKAPLDEAGLRAFGGELENELLAQTLRLQVATANRRIIEQVTALAIGGAAGPRHVAPAVESIVAVDDAASFIDDPLGIAQPWQPPKSEG